MIIENGSPERMEAVCKAVRPPPISNTEATSPSIEAQNIFCPLGALCLPPEVSVSTTNEPESEEVIKKLATSKTARTDV